MIPASLAAIEQHLLLWMLAMLRPGAAFLAAPMFSAPQVPIQLRLILALAIGLPAAQFAGLALPADGLLSAAGFLLMAGEVVVGLAIGFALQLGFAAALVAGEVISNAMGLGFAAMTDPMSGQSSPAVGHLLTMLATFLFLASDGHLLFARILVDSYGSFAPGGGGPSLDLLGSLARLGSQILAAGVAIALPVAWALVLVQLIMGVISRSAPSLNLFAVGMPAALLAGTVLMAMAAPLMADAITAALRQGLAAADSLAHGRAVGG